MSQSFIVIQIKIQIINTLLKYKAYLCRRKLVTPPHDDSLQNTDCPQLNGDKEIRIHAYTLHLRSI